MGLRLARFVNLLLASVLVGNEVGTLVVVHPALRTLPTRQHVAAEQELTRRFGALMPWLMGGTTLTTLPVIGLARARGAGVGAPLGALACYAGIFLVTFRGNIPLNRRTLAIDAEAPPADWLELRSRWEGWHRLRTAMTLAGWGLLAAGALRGRD